MAAYEGDSDDDGAPHVWLELYDRSGVAAPPAAP